MLKDKMEREIITRMARIAQEYVEPYDNMDRSPEVMKNNQREIAYDTLKDLLLTMWGVKK